MIYIALAVHDTAGHEMTHVICASVDHPKSALAAAKHAEQLGYTFTREGTGVVVYNLGNWEQVKASAYLDAQPDAGLRVYQRIVHFGVMEEEWFDTDLEVQFRDETLELNTT